jgi:hypothetical protein
MADTDRQDETQAPDEERSDAPEGEGNDASSSDSTEEIVSNHAEHDERFEEEMRQYMRHIDTRLSQLADAQAAIVSASRIDDTGSDADDSASDDGMDDGVLDLIIND